MFRSIAITVLCSLGLGLLSLTAQARELRIAPNSDYRVTPAEQSLELDRLIIGDGATVSFDAAVTHWDVSARKVRIGDGVVFDGRGEPGSAGRAGNDAEGVAGDCEDGVAGGDGGDGGDGGSGVSMRLSWGIAELGSLKILTDGGPGGAGGAGGRGQRGGDIAKCRGGEGGAGGRGGDGGGGGNAGEVELIYWPAGSELDLTDMSRRITVSSSGGAGGLAGASGRGGAGVEGRYMRGSFAGNKKWLAGGEQGAAGETGEPGRRGQDRTFDLKQDIGKFSTKTALDSRATKHLPAADAADTVPLQKRLLRLEKQLQAMEQRLRKLEQDRAQQ